jgi:flavin-dependent dehydrogenase
MDSQNWQRRNPQNTVSESWDCIVIGAGVAGLGFAIRAVRSGLRVLVIEGKSFPREKVCGGCLNHRAQNHLRELGVLGQVLHEGIAITDFVVHCDQHVSSWKIPSMVSIRRSTLDETLAQEALSSGCEIQWRTRGTVLDAGESQEAIVRIQQVDAPECVKKISAKMVVVAAGLTRSPIQQEDRWTQHITEGSRIGVHALSPIELLRARLPSSGWLLDLVDKKQLHMLIGRAGYLGICLADGGQVDFAAAIAPDKLRSSGGIAEVVDSILGDCRCDGQIKDLELNWSATPALTRTSTVVAMGKTYLIGDALGYVEPFTGEGMSWALESAKQLAEIVCSKGSSEDSDRVLRWDRWARRERATKQWVANWVAAQSRSPRRCAWILKGLDACPPVRRFLMKKAMQ